MLNRPTPDCRLQFSQTTRETSFSFFNFWDCQSILEIRDNNLQVQVLHFSTDSLLFLQVCLCLHFVNLSVNYFVVYTNLAEADTGIAFFTCQRSGWGHHGRIRIFRRKLWRKLWSHLIIFLSNNNHVSKSLGGSCWWGNSNTHNYVQVFPILWGLVIPLLSLYLV